LAQRNIDSQKSLSGYRVAACSRNKASPGEDADYSVLAENGRGLFTVWKSFNSAHGLNWGHYDLTLTEAEPLLLESGYPCIPAGPGEKPFQTVFYGARRNRKLDFSGAGDDKENQRSKQ
jgi:hypothetical protein